MSRSPLSHAGWLGYLEAGLDAPVATGYDPLRDDAPELAQTLAASVQQRIAFGDRPGQQVRRIGSGFGDAGETPTLTGPRCASVHGFSLHANTQVPAHRRDQLERLIRYTARGAVSLERLTQDANGDLVYTFTHPWSDGTTGIRLSPLELLEKLAALVPLPRVHLVRYGGCLAPHSHLRGAIIPTPRQQGIDEEATDTGSPRWNWVRLLKRVFALDMARCPWCQRGSLRMIAAITHGEGIRKSPASETVCRPPSHCPGPCPPGSLRLVLRLSAATVSCSACRLPAQGAGVGRHDCPGPKPPQHVSRLLVCRPPCRAACCTPARVCTRLSFVLAARCPIVCTRLSRRPSQRLQRYKRFCISLFKLSSRLNQSPPAACPRAAPAVPAARPQPPVLSVPCGADRRPAATARACGAGCAGPPRSGWARWSVEKVV